MRITCVFYGPIRDAIGAKTIERTGSSGMTVRGVLEDVVVAYPACREQLFTDGELRDSIYIMRNDRHIQFDGGTDAVVKDGDVIYVSPPVSGGAIPVASVNT